MSHFSNSADDSDLLTPVIQYGPIKPAPAPADNAVQNSIINQTTSVSPRSLLTDVHRTASDELSNETAEEKKKRITREKSAATRRRNKEIERIRQQKFINLKEQVRFRDEVLKKLLPPGVTIETVLAEQISSPRAATLALMRATSAKNVTIQEKDDYEDTSPTRSLREGTAFSASQGVAPSQLQLQRPLPPFTQSRSNIRASETKNHPKLPNDAYKLAPIRHENTVNLATALNIIMTGLSSTQSMHQTLHQNQLTLGQSQYTVWQCLVSIEQRLRAMNPMPVYIDQNTMTLLRNHAAMLENQRAGLELRSGGMEEQLKRLEALAMEMREKSGFIGDGQGQQ